MLSVGQRARRRSSLAVGSPAMQLLHDQYSPNRRHSRSITPRPTPTPSPRHSIIDLSQAGVNHTGSGTVDTRQNAPGIYLNRRYAVEVNAKDAALAAEIWKKSQTDSERITEAQRKRREHE